MIEGIAVLLLLQLVGEVAARGFGLPVPGPVIGMALLVVVFAVRQGLGLSDASTRQAPVGRVADAVLAALALLFVPAGVGIVQYLDLIGAEGLAIGGALVGSTVVALVATAATFRLVKRLQGRHHDEEIAP